MFLFIPYKAYFKKVKKSSQAVFKVTPVPEFKEQTFRLGRKHMNPVIVDQ
jgi:hypothetical protein